jgi:hypothetical protein
MAQSGTDDPTIHSSQPDRYVLGFQEIDQTQVAVVGGKGAHLGGACADRRRPRAGWLLRDDGRIPADHG